MLQIKKIDRYSRLQDKEPLAPPRGRNEASLSKRLKGFHVWSKKCLIANGLLESREQKHDRRVARQRKFLKGLAPILNEYGGAEALNAVLRDEYLGSIVTLKPIKQSKPEGGHPRHATRIRLQLHEGQVTVCKENVQIGKTATPTPDADEESQQLNESAKESLKDAIDDYVTVYSLDHQGF
jgi:hypothetical protein